MKKLHHGPRRSRRYVRYSPNSRHSPLAYLFENGKHRVTLSDGTVIWTHEGFKGDYQGKKRFVLEIGPDRSITLTPRSAHLDDGEYGQHTLFDETSPPPEAWKSAPLDESIVARQQLVKRAIAKKIKLELRRKGLTKSALIRLSGRGNATNWFTGKRNFSVETLVLIEEALGIDLLSPEVNLRNTDRVADELRAADDSVNDS